jgi:hypothetical protein
MKNTKLLFGLVAAMIAMSCSQALVRSDYDRGINFARYQTYAWQAEIDGDENSDVSRNALFEKRLKKAVDYELKSDGYQQSTGNPDFLVAWQLTIADKVSVDSRRYYYPTYGYGYWPGYYGFGFRSRYYGFGYGGFYGRDELDVDEYKEGTLVLDFIDPKTEALIWRGIYKNEIDESGIIPEEKIQKAVEEILKRFPPENSGTSKVIASEVALSVDRIAS